MAADIIDGKAVALELRTKVAAGVEKLNAETGVAPGLAVVLVGNDPASGVYVRNKARQTEEAGMNSFKHVLDADVGSDQLLGLVADLNEDSRVHGILVQLPLPDHLNANLVINKISPLKDVDGFHVSNAGRLFTGQQAFVPCTPLGCLKLLRMRHGDLSGLNAVVVGRSNIVGKPMASLLLQENCTVSVCHSRTRDLPGLCRSADILVVAIGRPDFVKGSWIKPGATVIDVGINRVPALDLGEGKAKLTGDVEYEAASSVAGAITPVPGGVGPMTIACLLSNTLDACRLSLGLPVEDIQLF